MKQNLQCLALLLAIAGCSIPDGTTPATLKHKRKPTQPEQVSFAKTWVPPTSALPRDFVEATTFLQSHGMADPRGGKFSSVHIASTYSQNPIIYFGWIQEDSDGQKAFIGLDGVARRDFKNPIPANPKQLLAKPSDIEFPVEAFGFRTSPFQTRDRLPLAAAMFLVDGETEVASKLLQTSPQIEHTARATQFISMASAMLMAKWNHCLAAFVRADDQTALNLVNELLALEPAYKKEAVSILGATALKPLKNLPANTDIPHKRQSSLGSGLANASKGASETSFPFNFLDQAPNLAEDISRRLSGDRSGKPLSGNLSTTEKIYNFVTNLQSISNIGEKANIGWRSSRSVSLAGGYVLELPSGQDEAAAALLKCAREDHRLTNLIEHSNDGYRIVPVRDLAVQIFINDTHAPFQSDPKMPASSSPSPIGFSDIARQPEVERSTELVQKLSVWWSSNRSRSPSERAFGSLADGQGNPESWATAAVLISPPTPTWSPGSYSARAPTEPIYPQLKLNVSPSVSELMAKRINQTLEKSRTGNQQTKPSNVSLRTPYIELAIQLCESLWTWDQAAALKPIQNVSDFLYALTERDPSQNQDIDDGALTKLFEHRLTLNDSKALRPYEQVLLRRSNRERGLAPSDLRFYYLHRSEPIFKGFSEALFLRPQNTSRTKGQPISKFHDPHQDLLLQAGVSPLLNVPEEREALLRLLRSTMAVGKVSRNEKGLSGENRIGKPVEVFLKPNDPLAPPPGKILAVRECDDSMAALAHLTGAPPFEIYWPKDIRDRIIKQTITLILLNKNNEIALLKWPYNWQDPPDYKPGNQNSSTSHSASVISMTSKHRVR